MQYNCIEVNVINELSPREAEIIELAILGHTNEGIAHKLEIAVGTVNTYWLRIRLKVGGVGRTDTVARVIKERSESALVAANVDRDSLTTLIAERDNSLVEVRASLALLQLAMDQIKSAVWATDMDLVIHILTNEQCQRNTAESCGRHANQSMRYSSRKIRSTHLWPLTFLPCTVMRVICG